MKRLEEYWYIDAWKEIQFDNESNYERYLLGNQHETSEQAQAKLDLLLHQEKMEDKYGEYCNECCCLFEGGDFGSKIEWDTCVDIQPNMNLLFTMPTGESKEWDEKWYTKYERGRYLGENWDEMYEKDCKERAKLLENFIKLNEEVGNE